jgi:hypothetical protein
MSNLDDNNLRPNQEIYMDQPAAPIQNNPHRLFQPHHIAIGSGLLVATALTIYGLKCAYEDPTTILIAFSIPVGIGILSGVDNLFTTMRPGN